MVRSDVITFAALGYIQCFHDWNVFKTEKVNMQGRKRCCWKGITKFHDWYISHLVCKWRFSNVFVTTCLIVSYVSAIRASLKYFDVWYKRFCSSRYLHARRPISVHHVDNVTYCHKTRNKSAEHFSRYGLINLLKINRKQINFPVKYGFETKVGAIAQTSGISLIIIKVLNIGTYVLDKTWFFIFPTLILFRKSRSHIENDSAPPSRVSSTWIVPLFCLFTLWVWIL